jgi:hypothetical protein
MSPGGALRNTLLLMPWSKFSFRKITIALFSTTWPKYGSHRTPALMVIRSVMRHASCAYAPKYQLWISRMLGPPISSLATRPIRKSARACPVKLPSMVHVPPVREVESVSNFQRRTLAPKPS